MRATEILKEAVVTTADLPKAQQVRLLNAVKAYRDKNNLGPHDKLGIPYLRPYVVAKDFENVIDILERLVDLQPISTTDGGTPNMNDMMKDPEYWKERKNKKWEIQWMSPDEYMERVRQGFEQPSMSDTLAAVSQTRVDEYAEKMLAGEQFPLLNLDYSRYFDQEGRHRALAAKKLGMKQLPVAVITKAA